MSHGDESRKVRGEKPLPIPKTRGDLPKKRQALQKKQKEEAPDLSLPRVPRVAPNEPYLVEGSRALMCAFILQAVYDVDAKLDYLSTHKNEEMKLHQISAIAMIRSPFFARLCGTLRLPADKIIRKALS